MRFSMIAIGIESDHSHIITLLNLNSYHSIPHSRFCWFRLHITVKEKERKKEKFVSNSKALNRTQLYNKIR